MNTPDCLLKCGCWVRRRLDCAKYGAVDQCDTHGETSLVRINLYEYHARCLYPACRYSRWFGGSQGNALQAQRRHKAQYPTHTTTVAWDRVTWDGKGSVFRDDGARKPKPPPETFGTLFADDGAPPF